SGYVNTFYEFEHNERHVEGAVGGALTDTWSARIAGLSSGLGGWMRNVSTGQTEGEERNRALRASFLFEPNVEFDALLKVEGGRFDVRGRNLQTLDCPPATGPAGPCVAVAVPVLAPFGPAFATPLFANFDDRFDTNT